MMQAKSTEIPFVDINGNPIEVFFLAMEYYNLILNRSFAIFVTKNKICGAKVIGVAAAPTRSYSEYAHLWRDPRNFITKKTIHQYEGIEPESPEFLKINKANFQINCSDVVEIKFIAKKKTSMGAIPHTGSLFIKTSDGKKREFIILADQDGEDIQNLILRFCYSATIRPT